ncbi:hypothetical protein CG91_gp081 [Mycobacterium phage 39HC]|uniref:hypothetical protein n=1 Tax=Mycobacterium phage 39HC TaxID=1463809 RepID=UPI0003F21681|nr:hypothetical protein CG91_gp081 [Mycobacterium phage 39HC]AHJ88381.1 hypothetical protein 39HC_081 [Mycobacterium phage 39HC]AHJ88481.1 hypothetical protein 40BC_081 [Mycobacterium phage 40BC]
MSARHDMEELFAERQITGLDGFTSVTGPIPWRRFHRDGVTLLFHVVIPRPVSHWNYEGRHRRPRPSLMPDGLVYVTEDGYVYRVDGEYPDECIARPLEEVDLPD